MRNNSRINELALLLSVLATKINVLNSMRMYDINTRAESMFAFILNKTFSLNLINLNIDNPNEPGIDLFDDQKKCGVQVTSENKLPKIRKTIRTVNEKSRFSKIIKSLWILKLKAKGAKHNLTELNQSCPFEIKVLDLSHVLEEAKKNEDINAVKDICNFLKEELGFKVDEYFRYGISPENFGESVQILKGYAAQYQNLIESPLLDKLPDQYAEFLFSGELIEKVKEGIRLQREPIGKAHLFLAQVYEMDCDYENAELHYQKAVENSPNNLEFIGELINFYFINQEYGKMSECWGKFDALLPTLDLKVEDPLDGLKSELEKRLKEAKDKKDRFKELTYLMNLAGVYFRLGDIRNAKDFLKRSYNHSIELLGEDHRRTIAIRRVSEMLQSF